MDQQFLLGRLSNLMHWSDQIAPGEFAWLELMSRMKYDGYQDFLAGMRFIESLADWLQQFSAEHRQIAYEFVKRRLIFVSAAEMNHLVELFYPEIIAPRILKNTAALLKMPAYRVWADEAAAKTYHNLLRKTVFVELSDGARIDVFRHANTGLISNEQIVTAPRIHYAKWGELLEDLRKTTGGNDDLFETVYLVDDFTASGKTLLRKEGDTWKGKLKHFLTDLFDGGIHTHCFAPQWTLCVHHYITTDMSEQSLKHLLPIFRTESGYGTCFPRVDISHSMVLTDSIRISSSIDQDFFPLIQRYYDPSILTRSLRVGGDDVTLGFGGCALPLILDHNTPNNSIPLLWAESAGNNGAHPMRPLFRRRQRHT